MSLIVVTYMYIYCWLNTSILYKLFNNNSITFLHMLPACAHMQYICFYLHHYMYSLIIQFDFCLYSRQQSTEYNIVLADLFYTPWRWCVGLIPHLFWWKPCSIIGVTQNRYVGKAAFTTSMQLFVLSYFDHNSNRFSLWGYGQLNTRNTISIYSAFYYKYIYMYIYIGHYVYFSALYYKNIYTHLPIYVLYMLLEFILLHIMSYINGIAGVHKSVEAILFPHWSNGAIMAQQCAH